MNTQCLPVLASIDQYFDLFLSVRIIAVMRLRTNIKTLKVRVKDKHKPILERMAFEVNQVWNAANEITTDYSYVPVPGVGYIRSNFTAFDLQKLLKSLKPQRGFIVHSTTVQEVIGAHHKARRQFQKDKPCPEPRRRVRWRVSGGPRRSLGWVPFKSGAAKWKSGQVYFAGHFFKVWDSYGLSAYTFRAGSFSQDTREGRKIAPALSTPR